MKRLVRLLGSIRFTVVLITLVALWVVIGTILEAATGSHGFAAQHAYDSPLFYLLLSGFFANILISALLRWPFHLHHAPFLITHLGLLMIILGTAIKVRYGIQGAASILEGSGTNEIALAGTLAITVRRPNQPVLSYPLRTTERGSGPWYDLGDDVAIRILGVHPHGREHFRTWIKEDREGVKRGWIAGLPLLTLSDLSPGEIAPSVHLSHPEAPWPVYALSHDHPSTAIDKLLSQHRYEEGSRGFLSPCPALQPDRAPKYDPFVAFVEETSTGTVHAVALAPSGELKRERFGNDELSTIAVFNDGYGGYGVELPLPAATQPATTHHHRAALLIAIREQIRRAVEEGERVAAPLERLQPASEAVQTDFPESCATLLDALHGSGAWLYPADRPVTPSLERVLQALDYLPSSESRWASVILTQLWDSLLAGTEILTTLERLRWPLLSELRQQESSSIPELLETITRQIFTIADQLPSPPPLTATLSPAQKLHYLSCELRAYGLSLGSIAVDVSLETLLPEDDTHHQVTLETSLTHTHELLTPIAQVEERTPIVALEVRHRGTIERHTLAFDQSGKGLRWPALNGRLLLSFEPQSLQLPYHLRLRDARQINYPNSAQPMSFEADLLVVAPSGSEREVALKMNHVHQTPDGYRFYLSAISPAIEDEVQRVQIIVNRDPVRYLLTYPGGILVALGIVGLFGPWKFSRPRRKRKTN